MNIQIAYIDNGCGQHDRSANGARLWMIDADGKNKRQVTSNDGWETSLSWSPDSRQIVFTPCVAAGGGWQSSMPPAAKRLPLQEADTRISDASWSPDL